MDMTYNCNNHIGVNLFAFKIGSVRSKINTGGKRIELGYMSSTMFG